MITDGEPFSITGVVVTEILQGLARDTSQIERYLAMWDMLNRADSERIAKPQRFSEELGRKASVYRPSMP
jgi:hypothetical protein